MNERQKQSLIIKIIAGASVFLFAVSIVVSIIIGGDYRAYVSEYERLHSEQEEIEQRILEQNLLYYEQLLKSGIYTLENGDKMIYNAIKGLYRYRMYIDNSIITTNEVVIRKPDFVLTLEEYYVVGAQNHVPLPILKEFSYLVNKGKGGDPIEPISNIFTEPNFRIFPLAFPEKWQVSMTRDSETYDFKTVITISVVFDTQTELEFNFGYQDEFKNKFGIDSNTITIRYI